jgi:hypothetical protein
MHRWQRWGAFHVVSVSHHADVGERLLGALEWQPYCRALRNI